MTLMVGMTEGQRGRQRTRWLNAITNFNGCEFEQTWDSEAQESPTCYSPECCRVGHNIATEQQRTGYLISEDLFIGLGLEYRTLHLSSQPPMNKGLKRTNSGGCALVTVTTSASL